MTTEAKLFNRSHRTTLVTFLALLFFFMILVIKMVRPYLLAIIMGGILTLLSRPAYVRLTNRGLKPKTAATIITLGILLLVVGPVSLFTTLAIQQGISVGQTLANDDSFSPAEIMARIEEWPLIQTVIGDAATLERQVKSSLQSAGKGASTAILGAVADIPQIILQIVLALISCFFLLLDGYKFKEWMTDKIPLDADVRQRITASVQNTTRSVIWATLAAAGAQAAVILIAFLTLGAPAAFLASGATFILAWIPMLGSAPVWIIGAIILYAKGSIAKCIAMVVFGIFTGLIDNLIRPLILKGGGSMHPLVSLVAILEAFGCLASAEYFLAQS